MIFALLLLLLLSHAAASWPGAMMRYRDSYEWHEHNHSYHEQEKKHAEQQQFYRDYIYQTGVFAPLTTSLTEEQLRCCWNLVLEQRDDALRAADPTYHWTKLLYPSVVVREHFIYQRNDYIQHQGHLHTDAVSWGDHEPTPYNSVARATTSPFDAVQPSGHAPVVHACNGHGNMRVDVGWQSMTANRSLALQAIALQAIALQVQKEMDATMPAYFLDEPSRFDN